MNDETEATNPKGYEMAYGMKDAKGVDREEMVSLIKDTEPQGATMLALTMVSKQKPKVRKNPGKDVYMVSQISGQINTDYEDAVNRQREKDGSETDFKRRESNYDFVSKAFRSLKSNPDKWYVAIRLNDLIKGRTFYVAVDQSNEAEIISFDQAFEWSYVKKSKPEDTAKSQEVEKPVQWRMIPVDNVAGFTLLRQEYAVNDITDGQKIALEKSGFIIEEN